MLKATIRIELGGPLPREYKSIVSSVSRDHGVAPTSFRQQPGVLDVVLVAAMGGGIGSNEERFKRAVQLAITDLELTFDPWRVLRSAAVGPPQGPQSVEELFRIRYAVLRALYETAGGRENHRVSLTDLTHVAALPGTLVIDALRYLHGEKIIGVAPLEQTVWVTHSGVVEYERSVQEPSRRTQHFTTTVIQYFNGPVGTVQNIAGTPDRGPSTSDS